MDASPPVKRFLRVFAFISPSVPVPPKKGFRRWLVAMNQWSADIGSAIVTALSSAALMPGAVCPEGEKRQAKGVVSACDTTQPSICVLSLGRESTHLHDWLMSHYEAAPKS